MLERGVYIAPALYEAGFVSAAHGEADIAATLAAAREACVPARTCARPADAPAILDRRAVSGHGQRAEVAATPAARGRRGLTRRPCRPTNRYSTRITASPFSAGKV